MNLAGNRLNRSEHEQTMRQALLSPTGFVTGNGTDKALTPSDMIMSIMAWAGLQPIGLQLMPCIVTSALLSLLGGFNVTTVC